MAFFVGIDLGTTGVKVGLFDESGRTVASASREAHLDTPAPAMAEFDADRYVESAFACVRAVLSEPGVSAADVVAIGVSSQAQTFVVADGNGRPLRPAVSWLDVRARGEVDELGAIAARLGRGDVNAVQSAPKLLWLRRHEPEVMARLRRVFVIPDYLIFRLTGNAVTDAIFASSTGLFDVWGRRWVGELLEACGLDEAAVPAVHWPGEVAGRLTSAAAQALGLRQNVIVAVGTNDQPCGALGGGNVTPGCASLALGTALAIILTSDTRQGVPPGVGASPHPAWREGTGAAPLYAILAYAKTSGIVVRWFRDTFVPSQSYEDFFRDVASVPIGADGVSCLPHFSGTATPRFDAAVRGAFTGLTLAHGRAHLARALAESLAFTVRDNVELLGQVVPVRGLRAIGGGSRSEVWLQMIADVTGLPVERPRTHEAACLGAAELAMVSAGRFKTVAEASASLYVAERRFEPQPATAGAYAEAHGRYRMLLRALYGH